MSDVDLLYTNIVTKKRGTLNCKILECNDIFGVYVMNEILYFVVFMLLISSLNVLIVENFNFMRR